jgi:hypothetical protein
MSVLLISYFKKAQAVTALSRDASYCMHLHHLVVLFFAGSSSFDPMKTRIWAGDPSEDVKVRSWNRMLEAANLTNPYQRW